MRRPLQLIRFVIVLTSIVIFILTMACVWMVVRGRWARVYRSNRILSWFCRFGLWILQVKVNPLGIKSLSELPQGLYVGNHLSYLDVLVISSHVPACFVTSVEIRDTPGLGIIVQMAGCLFVERRNKLNLH